MRTSDYVLDSNNECDRLERQAALDGLDRYLRHFPRLSECRVLDAGCGSGAMARMIASHNPDWKIVGVDTNSNYVDYARDRAREASIENLSFEQGDLQALRYPAGTFDVIWSRFVLYFLPDPQAAIAEFRRVIRPGGTVVVALHNWSTLINYPEDPGLLDRQRKVFPAIAEMRLAPKLPSMLTAGGFHDVSVEIQLDPIYSAVGSISSSGRRNFEEVFNAGINTVAEVLGGRVEAERFIADSLAYLDRSDTYTYSLLWTIKCRAPEAAQPSAELPHQS